MKLTLGFSPCPNDTFIFDALVNNRIDLDDFSFEPILEDVETLNQWAQQAKLDITKLSFPAFFESARHYVLMNAGSALGMGVGPLLVSSSRLDGIKDISELSIALPGEHTTANLLFSFAFPQARRKKFMVFSAIEDAVLNGEADLGVIIHENRFTYKEKGLIKIMDLGEMWEQKMKTPIPLGGIAIRKSIDRNISRKLDTLIRQSLTLAFKHYPFISPYVKLHSQTMSEEVMRQHIDLYVNDFSLELGKEGRRAILALQEVYLRENRLPDPQEDLFI